MPPISVEDEIALLNRWQEHKDPKALEQIVRQFIRLASPVYRNSLRHNPETAQDVLQEAAIGIAKAADRFEPEKGLRFGTYARWWVKSELSMSQYRQYSSMSMPGSADARKYYNNLTRHRHRLSTAQYPDELRKELAIDLGVTLERYLQLEQLFQVLKPHSLSNPVKVSKQGEIITFGDIIRDKTPSQEDSLIRLESMAYRRELLYEALDELGERDRDILVSRHIAEDKLTLEDLGDKYGITRERIRQLEKRAFQSIQAYVDKYGAKYKGFLPA